MTDLSGEADVLGKQAATFSADRSNNNDNTNNSNNHTDKHYY